MFAKPIPKLDDLPIYSRFKKEIFGYINWKKSTKIKMAVSLSIFLLFYFQQHRFEYSEATVGTEM